MVYHIEERLPYLTLTGVLNKQNMVTQNIQTNPDVLRMLSLSLISVPTLISLDASWPQQLLLSDQLELEKLSDELSSPLISFVIRQRAFKDYTNTIIPFSMASAFTKQPLFGMNTRLLFTIEIVFSHLRVFDWLEDATDERNTLAEVGQRVDPGDAMEVGDEDNMLTIRPQTRQQHQQQGRLDTYCASLEAPNLESMYGLIKG